MPRHLPLHLPGLSVERGQPLLELGSPSAILVQEDDATQVRLSEPLRLLGQARARLAQRLAPGLHVLRRPRAPVRPLQRLSDLCGMCEHRAQVGPDQIVELRDGDEAARAPLVAP